MDGAALGVLREAIPLLNGEIALEAWPVERSGDLGLVLVTSWRIIYVAQTRQPCATAIAQIGHLLVRSPTEVELTAWHLRLPLGFASASQCTAFLNVLRQDPAWQAVVEDARVQRVGVLADPC